MSAAQPIRLGLSKNQNVEPLLTINRPNNNSSEAWSSPTAQNGTSVRTGSSRRAAEQEAQAAPRSSAKPSNDSSSRNLRASTKLKDTAEDTGSDSPLTELERSDREPEDSPEPPESTFVLPPTARFDDQDSDNEYLQSKGIKPATFTTSSARSGARAAAKSDSSMAGDGRRGTRSTRSSSNLSDQKRNNTRRADAAENDKSTFEPPPLPKKPKVVNKGDDKGLGSQFRDRPGQAGKASKSYGKAAKAQKDREQAHTARPKSKDVKRSSFIKPKREPELKRETTPPMVKFIPPPLAGPAMNSPEKANSGAWKDLAGVSSALFDMETPKRDLDGSMSLTDPDSPADNTGPTCPMCGTSVDQSLLDTFTKKGRMNFTRKRKFCRAHKEQSARDTWADRGYPAIRWEDLESRVKMRYGLLQDILEGADCHYREVFGDKVRAGKVKNLSNIVKTNQSLTPGYYGLKGLSLMSDIIIRRFSSLLKERAVKDRLVSARGNTAFVQSVLVPELTVQLIMEDMKVDQEKARTILDASITVGELLNDDVGDMVRDDGGSDSQADNRRLSSSLSDMSESELVERD